MKKPASYARYEEIQAEEQDPKRRQNNDDVIRALLRTQSTGRLEAKLPATKTAFHMWIYILLRFPTLKSVQVVAAMPTIR